MTNRLRLVKDNDMPSPTPGIFDPCELWVLKEHMILILEMSIEAIKSNLEDATTPGEIEESTTAIEQRRQLLAWVQQQKGETVYMAMYPGELEEKHGRHN